MESERHNTHLLSSSSEEDKYNIDKTNLDMIISKQSEVENPNIHPNNKIDIKDIFKNLTEREDNKIIYLDENDEGNEEEKNENEEQIHYYKSLYKKKDNRKNITQNLKDWMIKKKQVKQVNTENFELVSENKEIKDEEAKNNDDNIKRRKKEGKKMALIKKREKKMKKRKKKVMN